MSHPRVHETPLLRVEVSEDGVSLKQLGGGPTMLFSPRAWNEFLRNAKEGKYDLPK